MRKPWPHFATVSYKYIHEKNPRRARASKFIHIYIGFRYAGVTTEKNISWVHCAMTSCCTLPSNVYNILKIVKPK